MSIKILKKNDRLLIDVLNWLHKSEDGVVLSCKETLIEYGISKSSYYKFLDLLNCLDFVEIIFGDENYRKVILKKNKKNNESFDIPL